MECDPKLIHNISCDGLFALMNTPCTQGGFLSTFQAAWNQNQTRWQPAIMKAKCLALGPRDTGQFYWKINTQFTKQWNFARVWRVPPGAWQCFYLGTQPFRWQTLYNPADWDKQKHPGGDYFMHDDMAPKVHLGEDYYSFSQEIKDIIFTDPIAAYICDYAVNFKKYWIDNTRNCIWKHDGTRKSVIIKYNKKTALIDHLELKKTGYIPLPGASEGWLTANQTWNNVPKWELIYFLKDAENKTYALKKDDFYYLKT